MSRERARRREERERQAAVLAAERAAAAERLARRRRRVERLTGWLPRPAPAPTGTLARRRRRDARVVLGFVLVVNIVVWLVFDGWAPRTLVLLLSLLTTPVVLALVSRK